MFRTWIFCFILMILNQSIDGQIILIDPGHGRCTEAQHASPVNGVTYNHDQRLLTELETAVVVGVKLRTLIQNSSCSWNVQMTRETNDVGDWINNASRNALSNTLGADIYLSIHTNAGPPSVKGAETFYCILSSSGSISFAESLHAIYVNAVSAIPIIDRRVAEWKEYIGANSHLTVLSGNTALSSLNELGFGTNAAEAAILNNDTNRDIFAEAYFEALQAELGTNCGPGCPQTATVNNNNISGTTTVSNSILSMGNVPSGNSALFDAGNFIDLQTGFEAKPGSVFEGQIGGCTAFRKGVIHQKKNRLQALHQHSHPKSPVVHVFKNSKENTLVFKQENIDVKKISIYNEAKTMVEEIAFMENYSITNYVPGTYYFRFYSDDTYIEHIEKIVII